jgi:hypothetical protein
MTQARIKKNNLAAKQAAIRAASGAIVLKHALACAAVCYQVYPVGKEHTDGSPHTRDTFKIAVGDKVVAQQGNFSGFFAGSELTASIIQYAGGVKSGGVKFLAGGAALFVEYGTIFMEARPILRAQVRAAQKAIMNDLRTVNTK